MNVLGPQRIVFHLQEVDAGGAREIDRHHGMIVGVGDDLAGCLQHGIAIGAEPAMMMLIARKAPKIFVPMECLSA